MCIIFKEQILAQYEIERTDTSFKRKCMFCRIEFCGSRTAYIEHLYQKHNLYFGKPENLVFLDELLDKIQNNIKRYCIYINHIVNVTTNFLFSQAKKSDNIYCYIFAFIKIFIII